MVLDLVVAVQAFDQRVAEAGEAGRMGLGGKLAVERGLGIGREQRRQRRRKARWRSSQNSTRPRKLGCAAQPSRG